MRRPVTYKIVNTITGEEYIGSSCDFNRRKREHLYDLRRGIHHSYLLQKAWGEYKEENFTFEVIDSFPTDADILDIRESEQLLIDKFKPRYNVNNSACGWNNFPVPVVQMSLTDEVVKYHSSIMDANLSLGRDPYDVGITTTCSGRQTTSAGYKWIKNVDRKPTEELVEISKSIQPGYKVYQMLNPITGEVEREGFISAFKEDYDTSAIAKVVKGEYSHHKNKHFREYEPYPDKKYVMGMDSGLRGGIALIDLEGKLVYRTPIFTQQNREKEYDLDRINRYIAKHSGYIKVAAVEEVFVIYGTAKSTAFKMGYGLGILHGMLVANGVSFIQPRPKEWQKKVCEPIDIVKDGNKKDTKATSIRAAERLFPYVDFTKSTRATKPHDGMTDASLIAEYARITETE